MTDPNALWFIDDGVPGVGERPAWLPEKYKTVADLAKSNAELEKRLGTIPEEYDFSKAKHIDSSYEPFKELQTIAKDKRVPKEVMDKVVDSFDKYLTKFTVDEAEEIKKLGDNAQDRMTTLDNWSQANLSKESYESLKKIKTADGIKAIEEIRNKFMSSTPQVPTGNTGDTHKGQSVKDIQAEITNNYTKYKADPDYRADITRRLELAAKNSPEYVDKVGS